MKEHKRPSTNHAGPLQRSKKDLIATAALATVAVVGIAAVWATAPVRHSDLTPAAQAFSNPGVLAAAPTSIQEKWRVDNPGVPGSNRPILAEGLVISAQGGKVTASDPATGQPVWTYERDLEVCSLGSAFSSVVVTYRNSAGCGDVTQIDAKTGTYRATRSAPAPETVTPVSSNDRVGIVSPERVELWRSDLVRTVEYGDKTAKQEPNLQPHEDCVISSALTRKELLAVVETCPDQPNNSMLRFQDATPEDSRKPKMKVDVAVPGTDSQLVAISQTAAAVYVPGTPTRLISYDDQGKETSRLDIKESSLIRDHVASASGTVFAPETSDLPHHMTWFDGERLYLLNPASLAAEVIFEGAVGTGVAVGDRIMFPIKGGIAVGNWSSGQIEATIPVDRSSYQGHVSLAVAGATVVEKRGETLVGLGS